MRVTAGRKLTTCVAASGALVLTALLAAVPAAAAANATAATIGATKATKATRWVNDPVEMTTGSVRSADLTPEPAPEPEPAPDTEAATDPETADDTAETPPDDTAETPPDAQTPSPTVDPWATPRRVLVVALSSRTPQRHPRTSEARLVTVIGQVSDELSRLTRGRIQLSVRTVTATVTTVTCDDADRTRQTARDAVTALGVSDDQYDYLVATIPLRGCTYAGQAGMGTLDRPGDSIVIVDRYFTREVVLHEFGHTIGLRHAASVRCPAKRPRLSNLFTHYCEFDPYGDRSSPMGAAQRHGVAFSAEEMYRLGVLGPDRLKVNPTGEIALSADDGTDSTAGPGADTRAVVLQDPSGRGSYWVEYRRPGQVERMLKGGAQVQIRWSGGMNGNDTALIDLHPRTATIADAGLRRPGERFVDRTGTITVRLVSLGSQAVVSVTTTAAAPVVPDVSVDRISQRDQWLYPVFQSSGPWIGVARVELAVTTDTSSATVTITGDGTGAFGVPGPSSGTDGWAPYLLDSSDPVTVRTVTMRVVMTDGRSAETVYVPPPRVENRPLVSVEGGVVRVDFSALADTDRPAVYIVTVRGGEKRQRIVTAATNVRAGTAGAARRLHVTVWRELGDGGMYVSLFDGRVRLA